MSECTLFPGFFGFAVQALLFVASVGTLVFKKSREKSGRTWAEFGLDSSKQLSGAAFIHCLNLLFAWVLGSKGLGGDACDLYWLNITIDCTLGVAINYCLLKAAEKSLPLLLGEAEAELYRTGHYGRPPAILWERVFKQLFLWLLICGAMKCCVLLIMTSFPSALLSLAHLFLSPLDSSSKAKLVVVMVVTPLLMNMLQFWITDNFIQKHPPVGTAQHVTDNADVTLLGRV